MKHIRETNLNTSLSRRFRGLQSCLCLCFCLCLSFGHRGTLRASSLICHVDQRLESGAVRNSTRIRSHRARNRSISHMERGQTFSCGSYSCTCLGSDSRPLSFWVLATGCAPEAHRFCILRRIGVRHRCVASNNALDFGPWSPFWNVNRLQVLKEKQNLINPK